MNSWILYSLALAAIAIITVLAIVAWRLQRQVRQKEQERAQVKAAYEQKTEARRAFVLQSLEIISTNALEEDLNLTEATIRCKILLDSLEMPETERQSYQILDQVFEQVQGFDTHQARKDLTPAERHKQDQQRGKIESEFEAALKDCFTRLKQINRATLQ
ncbi:DUF2489 domain-containing protein [Saccharospirillum sp.]|uniref:DUF2489 domain-containing protein n=1 Tax=Saccharospirillum sp. TaxID=2033801 RepID=UPI0034A079DE